MRTILITPQYHAILDNLGEAVGLGKIERVEVNGNEVTFVFSAAFLRQIGAIRPKYRLIANEELMEVRDADTWRQTDRLYRENPGIRPDSYVTLTDHEYGIKYHRCRGDSPVLHEQMRRIVAENRRRLEPPVGEDRR